MRRLWSWIVVVIVLVASTVIDEHAVLADCTLTPNLSLCTRTDTTLFTRTNQNALVNAVDLLATNISSTGGLITSTVAALPAAGTAGRMRLMTQYPRTTVAVDSGTVWSAFRPAIIISATDYNFTAQAPGGSIVVGANTVTLTPCPPGIAGSPPNTTYVYLSGGTGTAEAVQITGGSCVSNTGTGTITFTAANTHSGAWTVSSASGGIQEAINFSTASSRVYIPAGNYSVYATITASQKNGSYCASIFGDLNAQLILSDGLNPGFLYGPATKADNCFADVHGIRTITSGSVYATSGIAVQFRHIGSGTISDIYVQYAWEGIRYFDVFGTTLIVNPFAQATSIGQHFYCGVVGAAACATEAAVVNPRVDASGSASAVGIQIEPTVTGLSLVNPQIELANVGNIGLYLIQDTNGPLNEIQIANGFVDACVGPCLYVVKNTGAQANNSLQITNLRLTASSSSATAVVRLQAPLTAVSFNNNYVTNSSAAANANGIQVEGVTNSTFSGNTVIVSAAGNSPLQLIAGPAAEVSNNLEFVGNCFGCGGTTPTSPVLSNNANTNIHFAGNNVSNWTSNPFNVSNAGAGFFIDDSNTGQSVSTVTAAATTAFPIYSNFILAGATAVSAVSGLVANQTRRGTFYATNATPGTWTAGATIGNTFTPAQNIPVEWYWDGTKLYAQTDNLPTNTAGGLVYSTASALAAGAAGTSGYFARSGGTGAPTWLDLFGTANTFTAKQTMSVGAEALEATNTATGPAIALRVKNSDSGVTTSEARLIFDQGGGWYQAISGRYNSGTPYLEFAASTTANTYAAKMRLTAGGGQILGSPTGGDKGPDTLNTAGSIYVNNSLVGVVGTANTWTANQTISANLIMSGNARLIQADWDNGTVSNRTNFQTSTANGPTAVGVIPNGTSTTAGFVAWNNSNLAAATAYGFFQATGAVVNLTSNVINGASQLPMTFSPAGVEQVRMAVGGGLLVGNTSLSSGNILQVNGHIATTSTAPTVSSGCGTTPGAPSGTDNGFTLALGTGTPTSCVVNFATTWASAPVCVCEDNTTAVATKATTSTTQVTCAGVFVGSDSISVLCMGRS